MKKLLLLLVLVLTSFSMKAGDWIKVYEDSTYTVFLEDEYDEDYDGYLVWLKCVYKTSQKLGKNKYYKYFISLVQYNSSFTQSRDLKTIAYNKNGKVVDSSEPYYPEWEYIVPDSVGQLLAEIFEEDWVQ